MDLLESRSGSGGKNTSSLTDKLADIQEQVQDVVAKLAEKTGGDNADEGGGTIMNIKRAIKRIKEEAKDMQMKTAMIQQQLMNCRKEQMALNLKRKKHGRKKKNSSSFARQSQNHDDD